MMGDKGKGGREGRRMSTMYVFYHAKEEAHLGEASPPLSPCRCNPYHPWIGAWGRSVDAAAAAEGDDDSGGRGAVVLWSGVADEVVKERSRGDAARSRLAALASQEGSRP